MPEKAPERPNRERGQRSRRNQQRPGVQGIKSSIDDIVIRGESARARLGVGIIDARLIRTIGGASRVELDLADYKRRLLNSKLLQERHDLSLDHLPFRFVKATSEGRREPLKLTYEARAVALLRELHGPHKALRAKVTRAEFAKRRVMESRPRPRFICPQLHVKQPIENSKDAQKERREAEQTRRKGLGDEELTVKGVQATRDQVAAADRALRVAESLDAPQRVMVALIAALIIESVLGDVSSNWLQIISSTASAGGIDPNNLEQSVRGFLRGYYSGHTGAIKYFRRNPGAPPYEIAQAVQASGAGAASGGRSNYGTVQDEARRFVEAYGGGGTYSTVEFEPYAFEQGRRETHWACISRLAKEVRWRCFESAGWIYYINDQDLLDSINRMTITDSTPGILDTGFDYDVGKPISEVTVEANARAWAAPPGTVAVVKNHGPADGRYIVHRIDAPLRTRATTCEITLRRPVEPLPEPAPESKTVSTSFGPGGGATTGKLSGVRIHSTAAGSPYWGGSAAIHRQFVTPFLARYGLRPGSTKEQRPENPGSDHDSDNGLAYAIDYPTTDGLEAARDLAAAMGFAGWEANSYESFTVTVGGHRFEVQILWGSGIDHGDHIHVGAHRIS